MWKQLAILCVYIPSVHHLKEKTVSLAMLWLINTSRCSRDKLEKYQSLTRYRPGNRSALWKRFPFHCCSCWNDLNLPFFSCFLKKKIPPRTICRLLYFLCESLIPNLPGNQWTELKWLWRSEVIRDFAYAENQYPLLEICAAEHIVCPQSEHQGYRGNE